MHSGSPFVLGVNYWPRRKAMYWWSDFDAGEVRDEFALIRGLGLTVVRIFLLWDDFQPDPDSISSTALDHLVTACDIAADLGLTLDITFFTGHMSGPNWAPRWLLEGRPARGARQLVSGGRIVQRGYRNPFSDPVALAAERLLVRSVLLALAGHPAVGMWNLGNEPDLFAHPQSGMEGRAWARALTQFIHSLDPRHPVTCGLHMASLLENNGMRADQVFGETDIAVMHAYPMYVPWARSPLDPDLVPFACALTSALSGKPVLMEEFGGCTTGPGQPSQFMEWTGYETTQGQFMASEEDLAKYVEEVLPRLVEVGATGALLWCYADYAPELWDRPPCRDFLHERHFGLVRPDGSLKPHADVIQRFARSKPLTSDPRRSLRLDLLPEEFYQDPGRYTRKLYLEYETG